MNNQNRYSQNSYLLCTYMCPMHISLLFSLLVLNIFTSLIAAEKHTFEAESAIPVGGASKVVDSKAAGKYLVSLAKAGQGLKFIGLPETGKLAIRYASVPSKLKPTKRSLSRSGFRASL